MKGHSTGLHDHYYGMKVPGNDTPTLKDAIDEDPETMDRIMRVTNFIHDAESWEYCQEKLREYYIKNDEYSTELGD